MNYTVTYRGDDGSLREDVIEASGRSDCFARCKAKGIVAVNVQECGPNHPKQASRPLKRTSRAALCKRAALAVAAIVAILGAWWWLAGGKSAAPLKTSISKRIPTVRNEIPATKPPVDEKAEPERVEPTPQDQPEMKMVIGYRGGHRVTNWVAVASSSDTTAKRKKWFSSGLEEQLSWIFETELGDAPPAMLPRLSKRDTDSIDSILAREIVIADDDSERVKQSKLRMIEVKKALKEHLDGGGTVQGFLDHYHSELKLANAQWCDAKRSVIDLYRSDNDPSLVKSYIIKVNSSLIAKGIKPITLPKAMYKELGIDMEITNEKE